MTLAAIFYILAIVFCLISIAWLVLVVSALVREWNDTNQNSIHLMSLWRVVQPVQLLSIFLPQLFVPELGFRSIWFLFGYFAFILITVLPYYFGRKFDQRRSYRENKERRNRGLQFEGPVTVRLAQHPDDFYAAGEIFADVFSFAFDQIFGRVRAHNAALLGELLRLKEGEVYVATDDRGKIWGAMWVGTRGTGIQALTFKKLWPVLRRFLDPANAFYGALVGVPAMMADETSKERAYIYWLGVLPEAQGHGFGTKMLEMAEELARCAGHTRLRLHTESNNTDARHLYRHFGMVEGFRVPGWPRVRMEKKI